MVRSDRFFYNPQEKRFTADISELGPNFSLERLFNDSCDIGFKMISQWTGDVVQFVMSDVRVNQDGDVEFWEFVVDSKHFRSNPRVMHVTAMIFND